MNSLKQISLFILTLSLALLLEIFPWGNLWLWAQPQWVFLVIIFWMVRMPERVGVTIAWCVGLILDLLKGTLIGSNALIFALIAYLIIRFHPNFGRATMWQQTLLIFLFTMLNLALRYWIMGILGWPPKTWAYWLPGITTALCWPLINSLFKNYNYSYE